MTDSYYIDVRHDGLKKFRRVTGRDLDVVREKAAAQAAQWNAMWQKQQKRENIARSKEQKRDYAAVRSKEVSQVLSGMETLLSLSAQSSHKVDWDTLLDRTDLNKEKPTPASLKKAPDEPKESDSRYEPVYGLFDRFIKSWAARRVEEAKNKFRAEHEEWRETVASYKREFEFDKQEYEKEIKEWEGKRAAQEEQHNKVGARQRLYMEKDAGEVESYCDLVLTNSTYPIDFDKDYDIHYGISNGLLVVDYRLPNIEAMPSIKEVKYVVGRDELVEVPLSESARIKIYDDFLYQITLRTLYELFESDEAEAIKSIVFNGWVSYIDKGTGYDTKACILSIQAPKDVYLALKLGSVDPKECFRQLKGVGSPKLHNLTPVAPIVTINKEDKRFIPAYEVADSLDSSTNLAAMDWEDFENLIRELFEKEFVAAGGEVKITRASRDGGVDAVIFDPDPIRGGKIVIQAKRYTNLVGVSAVRDLYGTVMNEGATKGILVTTSHYGSDSYEFAKGKPLTLLDGNNLLFLLSKHGYQAKIDINEAKKFLNEVVK